MSTQILARKSNQRLCFPCLSQNRTGPCFLIVFCPLNLAMLKLCGHKNYYNYTANNPSPPKSCVLRGRALGGDWIMGALCSPDSRTGELSNWAAARKQGLVGRGKALGAWLQKGASVLLDPASLIPHHHDMSNFPPPNLLTMSSLPGNQVTVEWDRWKT